MCCEITIKRDKQVLFHLNNNVYILCFFPTSYFIQSNYEILLLVIIFFPTSYFIQSNYEILLLIIIFLYIY